MERDIQVIGDYLWDRSFAQAVDRISSEQFHIPSFIFMEGAGKAVADAVLELEPEDTPVLILCGPGSNGGDGLVAARYLADAGLQTKVFLVWEKDQKPNSSCQQQLNILRALGHELPFYEKGAFREFRSSEPIIIDAVLGIGLTRALDTHSLIYAALTEASQIEDATVVAVDIPSGLDVDSGEAQDVPLGADLTITFGGKKPAHTLAPARDFCGSVVQLAIGFPTAAQNAALSSHRPRMILPDPKELLSIDPWAKLSKSANKYDRGHVLIIGGSAGKTGAPLLAGMAALRSGAGWASISMPRSAFDTLKGEVPRELTFEELFDGETLNALKLEHFLKERKVKAVVIGPGSTHNPLNSDVLATLNEFSEAQDGFVVLDAGATQNIESLLTHEPQDPKRWVALPHPGEWKRIGSSFALSPLTPSGFKASAKRASDLGIALLFKNATPLLFPGEEEMPGFVSNSGDPILARAGSGDVLAGVCGAHGAIGLPSVTSTLRSQVCVSYAAKIAAKERGWHGVTATDIIRNLGRVQEEFSKLQDEEEDSDEDLEPMNEDSRLKHSSPNQANAKNDSQEMRGAYRRPKPWNRPRI